MKKKAQNGVVHAPKEEYARVFTIFACLILFVVLDLFCCVSGKLPMNEPYYLMRSPEEKALEQKIAEEAKRLKKESLTA